MRGSLIPVKAFSLGAAALLLSASSLRSQTLKPPAPGPLRPYVFPTVEQFQLSNGL
jgi:hypothetical protein